MDIFFIVLACLAAFHLLYEGIIAPELRMCVRNDLFEVRDSLRAIKCQDKGSIDDESFDIVHDAVNRFTHRVKDFTIFVVAQMRLLRVHDPETYEKVRKRSERLAQVPSEDFRRLLKRTDRILVHAMLINSGGWSIYIVPIAIGMSALARLSKIAMAAIALPGNLFDGIIAREERRIAA